MNSEYEFLSVFMPWFNENYGRRYGKFEYIDSVSVVPAGCGEGTCQWESIVVEGNDENWNAKTVVLENVDIIQFFRSVSA